MKSPQETVWILGLPVTFRLRKKLVVGGERVRGCYDKWKHRITLSTEKGSRRTIFFHEATHAAIDLLYAGGGLKMKIFEELACNLPHGVCESVTRDPRNAKLLRWLNGE